MQMNEIVGQVQHGARLPKREQALNSARATADTPRQAVPAGEIRDVLAASPDEDARPMAGTTVKRCRYGSGF